VLKGSNYIRDSGLEEAQENMALLSIWSSNPEAVLSLSIEQIVATAGDGKLRDDNECSQELRAFLAQVPSEKLAEYADHCLTVRFDKSGIVCKT